MAPAQKNLVPVYTVSPGNASLSSWDTIIMYEQYMGQYGTLSLCTNQYCSVFPLAVAGDVHDDPTAPLLDNIHDYHPYR